MVDDELGHLERANGVGEPAESLDVADVEDDQQVDVAQRRGALGRFVAHVVAEQEVEQLGPRRGIDDANVQPALHEHARERRLRATPVAVGVHVRRERHAPARHATRDRVGRWPRDAAREWREILERDATSRC